MAVRSAGNVFAGSWRLLCRHWIIVVPGLAIGTLAGIVDFIIESGSGQGAADDVAVRLTVALVEVVATILAIAYTTGMAAAAWTRGTATFADGKRAFDRDGGQLFVAMLVLFVLGSAATFASLSTFFVPLLLYVYFCIYTMAAAVVGERSGLRAVAESIAIAYGRPAPTLVMLAAMAAIVAAMGLVAGLLAAAPLIGPLVSAVVVQGVVAYVTLVVVGEYLLLRGTDVPC
jgi:hypothetical protein